MKGLLAELFRRHVPQITGLYVAAVWAIVQFVDWAVEEFVLSPHLTGFVFLLGLLLLPTVVLAAWNLADADAEATEMVVAGVPLSMQSWGRLDSAAAFLNVAVAVVMLFLMYGGRSLVKATNTVSLTDESGEPVTVQVPKREFVKELLVFHVDNESGDEELDWMSYAATLGFEADLAQDPFVLAYGQWNTWYDVQGELTEAGYDAGTNVPLALKRQLAENRGGLDHFLAGAIRRNGSELELTTELYETETGRLVARRDFLGSDLNSIIDEASARVRRDLDLPDYRLESAPDLPVAEVLTHSVDALRAAARADQANATGDFEHGTELLERAVAADSAFAWAEWSLAYSYLHSGRKEDAERMIERAMRHRYRLPASHRLTLQAFKYSDFDGDSDRALQTARYMVEIYPYDIAGRYLLASLYEARGDRAETVRAARAVLELNPSDYDMYLVIGQQLEFDGDYRGATKEYLRYVDAVPHERLGYLLAARAHRTLGEHEKAAAIYDRAQIAVPEEPGVLIARAYHELDRGDIEQARRYRDEALDVASPDERAQVAQFDGSYFRRLGRYAEAVEAYERQKNAPSDNTPLNEALVLGKSGVLQNAARAGRADWAVRQLDSLATNLPPAYDALNARSYLYIYADIGDTIRAREIQVHADSLLETLGFGTERAAVAYSRGRVAETRGDCTEALEHYRTALGIYSSHTRSLLAKARCERTLGRLADAERTVSALLSDSPAYPHGLVELAAVYRAMGRTGDARSRLRDALEIWRDADPDFVPAQQARRMLAELGEP